MSGSLGWRTQSTVLPSKAKEIRNVSARTMFDLKAALYAKEEEARGQVGRRRKRRKRGNDLELESENRGVRERAEREDLEHERKNTGAVLQEKSRLYSKLKESAENVKNRTGEEKYMVDFEKKDDLEESIAAPSMYDNLHEMEKKRQEWETETLRQMDDEADREEALGRIGQEALVETKETERQREKRKSMKAEVESRKLDRLRNIMRETTDRKFLDLEELGGLSMADAQVVSRTLHL